VEKAWLAFENIVIPHYFGIDHATIRFIIKGQLPSAS